jgi:hypothetical protein
LDREPSRVLEQLPCGLAGCQQMLEGPEVVVQLPGRDAIGTHDPQCAG